MASARASTCSVVLEWPREKRTLARARFGGRSEGGDRRNVFGARTAIALVVSAEGNRLEPGALACVKRADTLGGIQLVAAHAIEVDTERFYVHGNLAERLHAVHVERHS